MRIDAPNFGRTGLTAFGTAARRPLEEFVHATLSFNRRLFARFNRPNLNISERHLAVVPLQGDKSFVEFRECRHAAKFALGHALLEVVAPEDIVEIFYSI